jgi:hypothetical protein
MKTWACVGIALTVLSLCPERCRADSLIVTPSQYNTLFQVQSSAPSAQLSDGSGPGIFVGESFQSPGLNVKRGLVQFNLSSIPTNAIIESVSLKMTVIIGSMNAGETIGLHTVLSPWGAGGSVSAGGMGVQSQTGDASWYYSKFQTAMWNNPGGDFTAASSESIAFAQGQLTGTWSGGNMVQDVQNWVDGAMPNYGWALVSNEMQAGTAREFGSSAVLDVQYMVTPAPPSIVLLGIGLLGMGFGLGRKEMVARHLSASAASTSSV